MKYFYGVMCYACFVLTIASYMVFGPTIQAEVREFNTTHNAITQEDRAAVEEEKAARKASSLEVVWMENCAPCRRIKLVVKDMQEEGYDITLVYKAQDTRGSSLFPSLYYLGNIGGVIKKEVGYKAAYHIKQYLKKS